MDIEEAKIDILSISKIHSDYLLHYLKDRRIPLKRGTLLLRGSFL